MVTAVASPRLLVSAAAAVALTAPLLATPAAGAAPAAPAGAPAATVPAGIAAPSAPGSARSSTTKAAATKGKVRLGKVRPAAWKVPTAQPVLASAKVRWTKRGKRAATTVAFVLARGTHKRKGDTKLGTATGLGKKFTARAVVKVPKKTTPGSYRLLACVGATCKPTSKPVRVVRARPASAAKIAKAVKQKKLSRDKAILFRYFAQSGDKRLPRKYRGAADRDFDDELLHRDTASAWPALAPKIRKQVLPYLVPPTLTASAYALGGGYQLKQAKKTRTSNAWPGNAQAVASLRQATAPRKVGPQVCLDNNPVDGQERGDVFWDEQVQTKTYSRSAWRAEDTADGKARVWHRVPRPGEKYPPRDARADAKLARQIAGYLPGMWKRYRDIMGREPVSDGGHPCFDGGDGRYDLYVLPGASTLNAVHSAKTLHIWFDEPSCTGAAFTTLSSKVTRWEVAHELFHAFQYTFPQQGTNCGAYDPLDEGSASWAADLLVPGEQVQHVMSNHFGYLAQQPKSAYAYWPLWMYLAKQNGNSVIRSIYLQRKDKPLWKAVDAGVPGGLVKQWPDLARAGWNTAPPFGADPFVTWDGWPENPATGSRLDKRTLTHGSKPIRVTSVNGGLDRSYADVAVDPKVRTLAIENPGHADPTASLQAFVQYADGHWKYENYSTQDEIRFCPDRPEDRVRRLVLVTARADVAGNRKPDHRPKLTPDVDCSPHYRITAITGSFELTYDRLDALPHCHVEGTEQYAVSLDPKAQPEESAIESGTAAIIRLPALVRGQQNYRSDCDDTAGMKPDPCTSLIDARPALWWAGFYRPDGAKYATVTLPDLMPHSDWTMCSPAFHDGGPGDLLQEPPMETTVPWSTIASGQSFTVTVRQGPFRYAGSASNVSTSYDISRRWSVTFTPVTAG